ncbi:hypothetical protein A2V80_00875 [Candidatus Woesebacteria bacterium RBG_16_39_8b]|uniref:Uncharacterized protein n=1 Tax=Candidatus Woesebacteria bacterium RBG_16_39_8b TaxID=1802482 RepID=A0A1F7XBY3_9BACT|nr:MAG: hypothetical protein A2V80_00875 [Candidatus Woesebacteria bacterium RBG_16_39_8b]
MRYYCLKRMEVVKQVKAERVCLKQNCPFLREKLVYKPRRRRYDRDQKIRKEAKWIGAYGSEV